MSVTFFISKIHVCDLMSEFVNIITMQNNDGGWGFYVGGHSTMIGSALSYVALRLLGKGPYDGENREMERCRKWIIDHDGATGIPSWGKIYLSVKLSKPYSLIALIMCGKKYI